VPTKKRSLRDFAHAGSPGQAPRKPKHTIRGKTKTAKRPTHFESSDWYVKAALSISAARSRD
jgi:hypothetical protein